MELEISFREIPAESTTEEVGKARLVIEGDKPLVNGIFQCVRLIKFKLNKTKLTRK